LGGLIITFKNNFKEKLIEITELSKKINNNDKQKILQMMKEHIYEIEGLYNEKNEHWTIETADLIVLCYELLLMENKDIDDVFQKCLPRFYKKLNRLLEDDS
jgi:phosphoribosyl-ATP pyrophosphohydrolase